MLPRHDQNLNLNPSYHNTISNHNVATHGYPKVLNESKCGLCFPFSETCFH
jgi:hypothetical protein